MRQTNDVLAPGFRCQVLVAEARVPCRCRVDRPVTSFALVNLPFLEIPLLLYLHVRDCRLLATLAELLSVGGSNSLKLFNADFSHVLPWLTDRHVVTVVDLQLFVLVRLE